MWFTVWYCVGVESSMMFWDGQDWKFSSLAEAKAQTLEGLSDHWWVSERPGGWLEVRDQDFKMVYSAKKQLQQLKMF